MKLFQIESDLPYLIKRRISRCYIFSVVCCLILMLGLITESSAQTTGPAGVDNGLVTWLDASDVDGDGNATNQPADGTPVATWHDKSGAGNDATILAGQQSATFKSDASSLVGGNPVLDFPGNAVYVFDNIDIRASNMPEATIFTVYFHTPGSPSTSALWGNDNGDWDRFVYTRYNSATDGIASQGIVAPNYASMTGSGTENKVNLFTAVYEHDVPAGSSFYLSGKLVGTFHDRSDLNAAQSTFRLGWDGDNGHFYGRVAELLVYNRKLDACEIAKINKYLSDKYQQDFLNLASNYNWAAPYDHDVAEIGTVTDACVTTVVNEAESSIIKISNPTSNDTAGEFLGIAHDGGVTTSSTDVPSGYNNRITRIWKVDEDGDLGNIDLCFDLSGLGYSSTTDVYSLLSDTDGIFSDASRKAASSSINGNIICFSGVNLEEGEYITLGFSPVIAPTITTFSPKIASKGDTLEIKGSHFAGATAVEIGGKNALSFIIIDDETIRAVVDEANDGSVSVTNPAGTATAANLFTYNLAPVIATENVTLPGLMEDVASNNNPGMLISDLLSGTVSDADNDDIGIAVISRDADNGTWQFFENNIWWNFDRHAEASDNQSLLLSHSTMIRFIPANNFDGTATFIYRAWDQTTGTDHNVASTTTRGGSTAFSTATGTASISFTPINDAPIINSQVGVPVIEFDGANDYISFPTGEFGGDFTVEARVYVLQHQTWSRIFDMGNGQGVDNLAGGFFGASSELFLGVQDQSGSSNARSQYYFPVGQWKHVAFVSDGQGTSYIYIDGVEVMANAGSYTARDIVRMTNYFAKSNYGQDSYFRGSMREFRIWDVARSQSDIAKFKDRPLQGNENGLKVYYKTTEKSGLTLHDASGNGNDGTLENGAAWATYGEPLKNLIVTEDTETVIPGFDIIEADAGNNKVTLTLSSEKGILKFLGNIPGGLTASDISNNNTTQVTINATVAQINKNFSDDGFIFVPDANYNGAGKVQMFISDNGFTGSGGPLSGTYNFDVTVLPVNDPPRITSTAITAAEQDKLYSYTVIAEDPYDPSDVLTFSAPMLPSWLTIDPQTGVLSGTPASSDIGDHQVTVRVSDGTDYDEQVFIVKVSKLNVVPVIAAQQSFTIDEHSVKGTSVGKAMANDTDGDVLSNWIIEAGNTDNAFSIDPVTGEITVNNPSALDYEATATFDLEITVSDGKGTSTRQIVKINLNNVNEPPVITAQLTFGIDENSAKGTSVGIITASDEDGDVLSNWAIVGGNKDDAFSINPTTGEITVKKPAALDYEKNKTFVLQITVSDGNNTSTVQTVTINLEDVNEAPVIVKGVAAEIEENSPDNTVVVSLAGTDPEGDQLTNWAIVEGNTGGVFAIDPTTGVIMIKDNTKLDFETMAEYTLTISVSDGINTTTQTVTIRIKDIPENTDGNPVIFTAFSPNGDGVNDTWAIPNLGSYPKSVVKVFNSDGIALFSNVGYTTKWDGTYKGRVMPLGTYYYLIKLNDESKTIYKGHLMIID